MITAHTTVLYNAWLKSESAWEREIARTFPGERVGDTRYLNKAKGEPGTELRAAYDTFVKTGHTWMDARDGIAAA